MVGGRTADLAPSAAVKIFSAGTAGCVADLVTFPLDTAKVRLQVRIIYSVGGYTDCCQDFRDTEAIKMLSKHNARLIFVIKK